MSSISLKISVILIWKGHSCSLVHVVLVSGHEGLVDLDLRWRQGRRCHKLESTVTDQLSTEPEEWLLKVVVGLCRDIVVLQVLLSVEGDHLCLDLSVFVVDLVSAENDWDVLADSDEITMPVWNVFVCDSGGDIEHDDTTLSLSRQPRRGRHETSYLDIVTVS